MDIVINAALAELPKGCVSIASYHNYYHNLLACQFPLNDMPPIADL